MLNSFLVFLIVDFTNTGQFFFLAFLWKAGITKVRLALKAHEGIICRKVNLKNNFI